MDDANTLAFIRLTATIQKLLEIHVGVSRQEFADTLMAGNSKPIEGCPPRVAEEVSGLIGEIAKALHISSRRDMATFNS